jgi:hypothetical protein
MVSIIAKYKQDLEESINTFNSRKDLFVLGLNADPEHTMKWSHDFFKHTARLVVAEACLALLKDGVPMDEIHTHVVTKALRGALYPENSTSPASNLLSECTAQAWAEMEQNLRYKIRGF